MKPRQPHKFLDEVLRTMTAEDVLARLEVAFNQEPESKSILTIIANAGVHVIPAAYLRGEVYEASRGDWNVSDKESLVLELKDILTRLVTKLRSRQWNRIYLIPTGHPVLSLQVKTLVYRLLRVNTIDLYYKSGTYFEVDIDQRALALETTESD